MFTTVLLALLAMESVSWSFTLNRHAKWLKDSPVNERRAFIKTAVLTIFSTLSGCFTLFSWAWFCYFRAHNINIYHEYELHLILTLGIQFTHIHFSVILGKYSCLPEIYWPLCSKAIHKLLKRFVKIYSIDDHWDSIQKWQGIFSRAETHRGLLVNFLDVVPDLVWTKDEQNRFTYTNKSACEILLLMSPERALGRTSTEIADLLRSQGIDYTFGELCDDSDSITRKFKKPSLFFEFGLVKDKNIYLRVLKAPIFDPDNNIIGTIGVGRNVSWQIESYKHIDDLFKSGRIKEGITAFENHRSRFESFNDLMNDPIYRDFFFVNLSEKK